MSEDQKKELRLKKKDVYKMVKHYRSHTQSAKLKSIHFSLSEILRLFVDNKILDQKKLNNAYIGDINSYGVRLYLGAHVDDSTCPSKPQYKGHSTVIICNTTRDTKGFRDMLNHNKSDSGNGALAPGLYNDEGLDMGTICPPECPPTEEGYDIEHCSDCD